MIQLVDSQSVFKFSLRLHYHTNFSYEVHKTCSYRVFSIHEFKQDNSRTAAVIITLIFEKNKSRKNRKKRKVCTKPWVKTGKNLKFYETLIAELRLKDEYNFNILCKWLLKVSKKYFS